MSQPRRLLVVVLCLCVGAWGFAAPPDDPNLEVRLELQDELEELDPGGGTAVPEPGPALTRYRRQLVAVAGDPSWVPRVQTGTIGLVRPGAAALRLGVNAFRPEGKPRGTLLFVHGYMSHAANFAFTFREFTRAGWNVVTLDLPGHGLSTGPRADIDTFSVYGDAVRTFLDWVERGDWEGPRVLMAHSLGSAASLEALRRPGTPQPDRVVFCAPLLRPDWYPALVVGERMLGRWLHTMPSSFGWDGYLDGYSMPVHWFSALDQWLEALKHQPPLGLPLSIYSGDQDTVVDEGWNRQEYRRLVPAARYVVLPGRNHLFLTENVSRQSALDLILRDLEATLPPPRGSSP